MALHAITRGAWSQITPRPKMLQGSCPYIEIIEAASEPDILDCGVMIREDSPTLVPAGETSVWCRIHPASAWQHATLRTFEAAIPPD